MARAGATRYCMVMSGRGPTVAGTRRLADIVRKVKSEYPIEVCLSVGLLGEEHARILADAGLDRLNHNLNTSEDNYGDTPEDDVYAFARQLIRDCLHARTAHSNTCADRINSRIVRLDCDLRPQTRISRRPEYLDQSLPHLRDLDFEQLKQEFRG